MDMIKLIAFICTLVALVILGAELIKLGPSYHTPYRGPQPPLPDQESTGESKRLAAFMLTKDNRPGMSGNGCLCNTGRKGPVPVLLNPGSPKVLEI